MRQLKGAICLAAIGMLVVQTVHAELVSIVVGDKMFSEFSISHCSGNNGVVPYDNLHFSGTELNDGSIGLYFDGDWAAEPNEHVTSWISYTVSVLPEYQDQFITGSTISITDAWAASSRVEIESTMSDGSGNILGQVYAASNHGKVGSGTLSVPSKQIRVETVVTLTGVNDGVHLWEFQQSFAQIPEPASMGMLGAGSIFSLMLRKKNRRRTRSGRDDFDSAIVDGMELEFAGQGTNGYVYTGRERLKSPIF